MAPGRNWNGVLMGLLATGLALGLAYAGTRDEGTPKKAVPPAVSVPSASSGEEDAGTVDPEQQEADAFAQKALETLRIGGVRGELRYDPERFLIQVPGEDGGEGMLLYLTNLYEEYRAAPPGMRTQVLERVLHVQQAPDLPEGYAEVRSALLPVVRPRSYFEMLRVKDPSSPLDGTPSAAWRPLGEVLAVSLVHDLPETMRYIGPSDLEHWDISFDEAYAQALKNLQARSREPLLPVSPGVCAAAWGDSYSPSRLLLDEVVKRCKVRGEPVVLAPNRDLLLITGSKDEQGLKQMAEVATEAFSAPRPIDGRALRRTAKGWEPFLPERTSASWPALSRLAIRSLVRDYADQADQLNAAYLAKGMELFVSTLIAVEDDDGRIRTLAIWVSGLEALLPRADSIIFMDGELGPDAPPVAVVPWEQVTRDAGHLIVREKSLYPERYRLKGFPSQEQFDRWKAAQTAVDAP